MKFCWAVVPRDFLTSVIKVVLQPCFQEPQMHQCTERHISSENYQRRRSVLGDCREALEDSSKQVSSFFHAWSLDPTTVKGDASALISPAGTSAGYRSHWDSWAGASFIDSCARVYSRSAPCCAKAGWLNQTVVNLLWMFHNSLDLPIVSALIAPLLLVWLPGGSQPGPRDGKSS